MLTKKQLGEMKPNTIFAQGETTDDSRGINLATTGITIKWVAVRGDIPDWAIYADNPYTPQADYEGVERMGDKIHAENHIKKLVPCDEEAFKMYRY